jgi:hypothetical protein
MLLSVSAENHKRPLFESQGDERKSAKGRRNPLKRLDSEKGTKGFSFLFLSFPPARFLPEASLPLETYGAAASV